MNSPKVIIKKGPTMNLNVYGIFRPDLIDRSDSFNNFGSTFPKGGFRSS
jgi:hypothetical protein